MKINNTKRIAEKMAMMLDIHQAASTVNTVITQGIKENSIIPSDIEGLRNEAINMKKEMAQYGQDVYSIEQAMLLLAVESIVGPYIGNNSRLMDFFMGWIAHECKVFDVKEFCEDPYIKNISYDNHKQGDYELRYHEMMPYELDIYDIPKHIDELNIHIPRISCFTETFKYPVVFQNSIKSTWMSVSPNEVFTMKKPIKKAKGKVLTLGCGMGYFAYMASLKEDVESITIVEIQQDVIDLFNTFILPQFENRDKIKIIKADAIEYLKSIDDGEFDYCFADIWIGIGDVASYFATKEIGRSFKKTMMEYWIEESFGMLLESYVYVEIMKAFSEVMGIKTPDDIGIPIPEEELRTERYVKELIKNIEITKPEHIDYYLNPKNIISLIDMTDIKY